MSRLVKVIDGVLHVAHEAVYAPGYTVLVSDGISANGCTYYADDVEPEDFAQPWVQPSAEDAYGVGDIVSHNGQVWRSTILGNVWEPGISGWVIAGGDVPAWIQPSGAHDAYAEGAIVQHNGQTWKNLTPNNTFAPGVSGWRAAILMPPSGDPVYPAWVQPTGGHDAYAIGDKVTHNEQVWTSTTADNVWEPGVFGWVADV